MKDNDDPIAKIFLKKVFVEKPSVDFGMLYDEKEGCIRLFEKAKRK